MAGTSPRRSIRSRNSHPQNFTPQRSSTSSSASGRGERTTRYSAKAESPRKHTSNESLSSEPPDDTVEESLATRRRKRGQAEERDKEEEKDTDMSNGLSEPVGEDDEAVRCICGSDEYPGPPQISEEDSKKSIKDDAELELLAPEDYTEDLAGFFLQCDTCKVWQHGGCVGIKNEDMSPDEYFCELCRPSLHKIYTASNGQKYSHYLPLYQHLSRSTSRAASFSKDGTRSPRSTSKNPRPTSSASATAMKEANAKRRSTMNSRDAAYDEEEQLRRAIAASKGEKLESVEGGGTRRTKRGRSDSEEKQEPSKRQRTVSRSASPQKQSGDVDVDQESDNERNGAHHSGKKIRGAAARNHREKELREERERARLEAANKRKGRAERRRVDDSDNGHEIPILPTPRPTVEKAHTVPEVNEPPPSTQDTPNNSPPTKTLAEKPKKGGRPPHPRKGKAGKNQYTRDVDGAPARSASRDVNSRDEPSAENNRTSGRLARNDTDSEKPHTGRGRPGTGHGNHKGGHKVSMLDMRRRVAGMLDFISRTQLEMAEAGEVSTPAENGREDAMRGIMNGMMPVLKAANVEGDNATSEGDKEKEAQAPKERSSDFKELNLLEMMDVLTGELVKWQKAYT